MRKPTPEHEEAVRRAMMIPAHMPVDVVSLNRELPLDYPQALELDYDQRCTCACPIGIRHSPFCPVFAKEQP